MYLVFVIDLVYDKCVDVIESLYYRCKIEVLFDVVLDSVLGFFVSEELK